MSPSRSSELDPLILLSRCRHLLSAATNAHRFTASTIIALACASLSCLRASSTIALATRPRRSLRHLTSLLPRTTTIHCKRSFSARNATQCGATRVCSWKSVGTTVRTAFLKSRAQVSGQRKTCRLRKACNISVTRVSRPADQAYSQVREKLLHVPNMPQHSVRRTVGSARGR